MAFDRRNASLTVPNPAATVTTTLSLKWDVAELIGFRALLTGTDTAVRIRITDADSRIVYLDAADADYKTAAKNIVIAPDATLTGLSTTHTDATGAALTVGLGGAGPVVRSPLEVAVVNGGTAGDVISIDLDYRGPIVKQSTSLTVPNPAATVTGTMSLGAKYAQILGISALLTGTDVTTRLRIVDADSKVIFLDAADRDYKTAKVHLQYQHDDTTTGLSWIPLDATGAAVTAASGAATPLAKSPLTLAVINGGTAGDVVAIDVYYRNS